MERRYSEEEAQRIFAAAAERQKHEAPGPDGLTLAELQEVARASGLDPAVVASVAAEREAPEASGEVARVLGLPAEARRVRVIPGGVSDAAWEAIVADLRARFKLAGNPSQIGRVREWTAGDSYGSEIRFAVEPLAEGARVVAEHSQARQSRVGVIVGAVFLAVALAMAVLLLATGAEPDLWSAVATFGTFAALAFGGTWAGVRLWTPRAAARLDALLDRADLAARDAFPAPEATAARGARVDLDALPGAPGASGETRTRSRDRS